MTNEHTGYSSISSARHRHPGGSHSNRRGSNNANHSNSKLSLIRLLFVGLTLVSIQAIVNLILYLRIYRPEKDPILIQAVAELQEQIQVLQDLQERQQQQQQQQQPPVPSSELLFPRPYQDDGDFYPFTIRDAKRLTPVQVPSGFHIFDYLDTTTGNQRNSRNVQLWLDAYYMGNAPCQRYMILCYKQKILQVFDYLLHNTTSTYFFYMEADNELCVPLDYIRDLAYRHRRYFIGTGIGFSGWIMNRTFMEDFVEAYRPPHKHANESPDPIGARLLMEKKAWTVTRQYLVSHTIKQGLGAPSLTIGKKDTKTGEVKEVKHLPRCFEPKRTKWLETNTSTEDMHGWDFFDSDDCPPGAEIYPCRDDQYVNVTYGVKDMLKDTTTTNQTGANSIRYNTTGTSTTTGGRPSQQVLKNLSLLKNGDHPRGLSTTNTSRIREMFNRLFEMEKDNFNHLLPPPGAKANQK